MIEVLGVLLGIDMQTFSRPEGSEDLPPGVSTHHQDMPPPPASPKSTSPSKSKPNTSAAPPAQEDIEMSEEDSEEAKAKKEGEAAKKAGSEAYKNRNFDEAAKLFEKAWDVWPKDITFLTNASGASTLLS